MRSSLMHVLLACVALVGCGCSTTTGLKSQAKAEPVKTPRDPLQVTAAESLLKQLKLGEPAWDAVTGSLRVSGRVEADETRLARISAPVTGRITELGVTEGQRVKRGELLSTLYSTDLSNAQSALIKAYSRQELARRANDRAALLLKADVIAAAEVQRREAELLDASAEVSSLNDQLRVLGMTEEAIARLRSSRIVNSVTHLPATIDGTVLERKVTLGQFVQPAETLFIIGDLSSVWLVADVPEQIAGAITVGKTVEARIPALPGHTINGKLSFVSAIVNPETRTVRVRMDLPNPKRWYKPAMLAEVMLQDAAQRHRVIPAAAVIRESNQTHVFVDAGGGKFTLRPVELGEEFTDKRVLISGIQSGERIVLDGAFHLNNERKRQALQGE